MIRLLAIFIVINFLASCSTAPIFYLYNLSDQDLFFQSKSEKINLESGEFADVYGALVPAGQLDKMIDELKITSNNVDYCYYFNYLNIGKKYRDTWSESTIVLRFKIDEKFDIYVYKASPNFDSSVIQSEQPIGFPLSPSQCEKD
ncbi:hypothetical protein [Thalassomonas sp. M1454]|uniref:hypothetical protein n=1 Tax=Thalassomonas sp. M1454 TaxID=2594477 RepID=UPI00163D6C43|nr:hypothetical protein [Thalassomonas sp. M1454]